MLFELELMKRDGQIVGYEDVANVEISDEHIVFFTEQNETPLRHIIPLDDLYYMISRTDKWTITTNFVEV